MATGRTGFEGYRFSQVLASADFGVLPSNAGGQRSRGGDLGSDLESWHLPSVSPRCFVHNPRLPVSTLSGMAASTLLPDGKKPPNKTGAASGNLHVSYRFLIASMF
jgi:hypothetical protein